MTFAVEKAFDIVLDALIEKSKDEIVELLKEELEIKEENALELLEMYDK